MRIAGGSDLQISVTSDAVEEAASLSMGLFGCSPQKIVTHIKGKRCILDLKGKEGKSVTVLQGSG